MSGKHFIQPFPVITAGDMSADITSLVTDVLEQDNVCYQVKWAGASLVGRFQIEFTNDDPTNRIATATWTQLTFDFSQAVPADTGDGIFNLNQIPGRYVRFHYVATSGTGTLNVKMSAKGLA